MSFVPKKVLRRFDSHIAAANDSAVSLSDHNFRIRRFEKLFKVVVTNIAPVQIASSKGRSASIIDCSNRSKSSRSSVTAVRTVICHGWKFT
jgi:hypothetical protein